MAISPGDVQLRVALIVKNADPSEVFQIFVMRQRSPGGSAEGCDSQLWDLPSALLVPLKCGGRACRSEDDERLSKAVSNVKFNMECLGLKGFDIHHFVSQIQSTIYPAGGPCKSWRYWKYVEEPAFGPGPPLHTIIFITETHADDTCFSGDGRWFDPHQAYNVLVNADVKEERIGPLAMFAFSSHFPTGLSFKYNLSVHGQEYPPGIFVAPMDSATHRPFSKTNLVVFAPTAPLDHPIDSSGAVASADALICDPGCYPATAHAQTGAEQLAKVVNELPKKLLVFITHHHYDHIDGLPSVRQNNMQAIIVAHEKTIQRMGKATAGMQSIMVQGGSKLLIAGQELDVVSAPGHTDGHLGLLHRATGTLLVGDHCVGHGSSVLDPHSGGNMEDYLNTCHRLLELTPKVIVPAHGHPTLWPMHLLQSYIKHREAREAKVLTAIKEGARTAHQVVAQAYNDTPTAYWPNALMNVKLHVEHLQFLGTLPPDFDMEEFERSCKTPFMLRCFPAVARAALRRPFMSVSAPLAGSLSAVAVLGAVACLWTKKR